MKSLLQTPEWVSLKVSQGWKSHEIDGVFVLEKKLPMGKSFLYAPEVSWVNLHSHPEVSAEGSPANAGSEINSEILRSAQNDSTIFFRLEILDEKRDEIVKNLKKNKFIKAFEELQPEWRQIIDISKTEEEILAQMKPKGRYNIKVAQKHNVQTSICPIDRLVDGLEIFYNLYGETADYQKISLRNKNYFLEMLKALYPKGEAAIIMSRYENTPLSVLIVTFYDGVASYLYGGTSRLHKNVMAPYAAHWEAIKLAKEKGCQKYDLLAIAPPEVSGGHKYANITFFKEQFGGKKVNIIGSWDYIYKPLWYKIFRAAETFRRKF